VALTVREIMNPELFSLRAHDSVASALRYLSTLDVSGAPVLDAAGRPVGMISFRDLLPAGPGDTVETRMSAPVVSVAPGTTIREAARLLGERGFHRLVVVREWGDAVGIVSALDVMRALAGLPASHPSTFPHFDRDTGLTWSDDTLLDHIHVERAPSAPGILRLRVGGTEIAETDVWIEPAGNLRDRLRDMLARPQPDRRLSTLLDRYGDKLRYRAAVASGGERETALAALRDREDAWVWARSP
jgi:CBS domain-containing protein